MNKKVFSVFFALPLSVIPVFPTLAAGDLPRLVDAADLLSDSEEAALLDEISERQQVDVVVLALDSLEGESAMVYADDFITQAKAGTPYDVDNLPKAPFSFGGGLVAALLVGFIISLIATGIMKGQLKTVHSQATDIKEGSMQLTKTNDLFLYRQVERREKAKEDSSGSSGGSSTHTSSPGTEHGGSQGKF